MKYSTKAVVYTEAASSTFPQYKQLNTFHNEIVHYMIAGNSIIILKTSQDICQYQY